MKKILLVLVFSFFAITHLKAQDGNNLRVEIELDGSNDEYHILPIGTKGVIMFNEIDDDKTSKDMQKYVFTLLDNNFEKVWAKKVEIPEHVDYKKQFYDPINNELFILFSSSNNQAESYKQYELGDYTVVKVNVDNKEFTILNELNKLPVQITGFTVYNQKVYLGGYTVPSASTKYLKGLGCYCGLGIPLLFGILNYKPIPMLITFDFANSKTKTKLYTDMIPGQMNDLFVSDGDEIVYGLFNTKPDKNTAKMLIKDINDKDNSSNTISFKMTNENDILNPKLFSNGKNEKILIGGFADAQGSYRIKDIGMANTLRGLVFSDIVNDQVETIKYHTFKDLKNVTLYYQKGTFESEKHAKERAKKQLERNGKENIKYHLLIHDIISVKNDEYIMIAENYYPQYHTEYITTFNANGGTTTTSRQIFDGYRYTNGMVVAFDKEGNILWDQAFEIENVLTYNLKQRIKVSVDNDKITCVFNYEGKVKSVSFENGEMTNEKTLTKLKTNYKNDKVKEDFDNDIDFWYDNYIITYGYQKIKNTSKKGKKSRTVFYFNKIEYGD